MFKNTSIRVGDDESVGVCVKVGDLHADFLGLKARDWADLGHEQDYVAHVDVVADSVENEKEV